MIEQLRRVQGVCLSCKGVTDITRTESDKPTARIYCDKCVGNQMNKKEKQYAVFVDYCDAGQQVFDSLEEAEKDFDILKNKTDTLDVYLCEVIKCTNRKKHPPTSEL